MMKVYLLILTSAVLVNLVTPATALPTETAEEPIAQINLTDFVEMNSACRP